MVIDVYYVSNLTNNLLSIGQLQEKHLTILIKNNVCNIFHQQKGLIVETHMTMNRMFLVYAKKKPALGNCLKVEEKDLRQYVETEGLSHTDTRDMDEKTRYRCSLFDQRVLHEMGNVKREALRGLDLE